MIFDNESIYIIPEAVETRWATAENPKGLKGNGGKANKGRKGAASLRNFKPGEQHVLAEAEGTSGIVRRIWVTLSDRCPEMFRGMKLDIYWDNALKPAISCPLADFMGIGLGQSEAFESAFFSSPEGRSFNCFVPMPFKSGMRITVTNETSKVCEMFYYEVDYTINDILGEDVLYLHSYFNRQNPTTIKEDYVILPTVKGKGRYLGANFGVAANKDMYFRSWWGEGEVKVFLDGDNEYPTLCGTGTEDYIGTGWGQGIYSNLFQGCTVADHENQKYCFYRYHICDPVYFRKDIKITIQQIGCWDPESKKNFHFYGSEILSTKMEQVDFSNSSSTPDYGAYERMDDWSSCVYFYLDRPESELPELIAYPKRV